MKANAPEKIYIHVRANKELGTTWHGKKITNSDIEYIRKDTFIEKACSWLKENKDKYLYNTGERWEYIPTCSGKMIDDFRNYMEGE